MFSADAVARKYLKEGHCERKYLTGVLQELESLLRAQPDPPEVEIHILGHLEGLPADCDPSRSLVLSLSEEKRLIPRYFPKVLLIFKQHAPYLRFTRFGLLGFRPANLFPLPLGYDSHVPYFPPKPAAERTVDVFFSGSSWKSRRPFFRAAKRLADGNHWRVEVTATDGFHAGLSSDAYGRKLADTKVALCPKGFVSSESFRLFEALRAGCIVVTVRQPRSWYTEGWPVIELRRWSALKHVVDRILSDKEELARRQGEIVRWWNERCSERSVAEYIGRACLRPRPSQFVLFAQGVVAAIINIILAIENRIVRLAKALLKKVRGAS